MTRTYFSEEALRPNATAEKRLLQFSLLLPLVVPFLAGFVISLTENSESFLTYVVRGILGLPLLITVYSVIIGGIPYVFFMVGLLVWSRGKSDTQIHRMFWFSPLLFTPVFWLFAFIAGTLFNDGNPDPQRFIGFSSAFIFFSGCILVLGYIYVIFVSAIYYLFKESRKPS